MEKTRVLVLEDDPQRHDQFKDRFIENGNISYTIVETAEECICLLSSNEYELVMLDHDLGGEVFVASSNKNTGAEVARWIAENYDNISGEPTFIVHSLNPGGSELMEGVIKKVTDSVCRIPFVWAEHEFKRINFNNG